jgi:hypothetical protein
MKLRVFAMVAVFVGLVVGWAGAGDFVFLGKSPLPSAGGTIVGAHGGQVYLTDQAEGLKVFDVSNPAAPALVAKSMLFAYYTGSWAPYAESIALRGSLVWGLDGYSIKCFDLADPEKPLAVAELGTGTDRLDRLALSPDGLRLAGTLDGKTLIFFEHVAPAQLSRTGSYTLDHGELDYFEIANEHAYFMNAGDLAAQYLGVLSLKDPAHPALVGWLEDFPGRCMRYRGGMIYAALDDGRNMSALGVVDVSDPQHPRRRGSCALPGVQIVLRIALANGWAFVAHDQGLSAVQVADPDKPSLRETLPMPAGETIFTGVAVQGDLVFASTDHRLYVYRFLPARAAARAWKGYE